MKEQSEQLLALPPGRQLLALPKPRSFEYEEVNPLQGKRIFMDEFHTYYCPKLHAHMQDLALSITRPITIDIDLSACSIDSSRKFLDSKEVDDLNEVVSRLGKKIGASICIRHHTTEAEKSLNEGEPAIKVKVDMGYRHRFQIQKLTALRAYREFHSMMVTLSSHKMACFKIVDRTGTTTWPVTQEYGDHPKLFDDIVLRALSSTDS